MKFVEPVLRMVLATYLLIGAGDHFFWYLDRPEPPFEAQEFLIGLTATGYWWPMIGLTLLTGGALLCFRSCSGLAIVVTAPVTVNLLLYHVFLDPEFQHALPGVTLALLQAGVAWLNRERFASLLGR